MSWPIQALRRLLQRETEEGKFFRKPYEARVKEVTRLYGDHKKRQGMQGYFDRTPEEISDEQALNIRPFYDVVLGATQTLRPKATMQLGCYTATELQWLRSHGLGGKLIAADHSREYLEFLEQGFAKTPFSGFEYRCFNLDRASAEDFDGVDMVTAMAVLSNVQPESMDPLFEGMAEADVQAILIGDMYTARTLAGEPDNTVSVPLTNSRNWAHPYRALGRRHGFRSVFMPCFTYSSFREARGIWLLGRDLNNQEYGKIFRNAVDHYVGRQERVWDAYGAANTP